MADVRQMRAFLAVARHLHFRRAAEELNLAQPSLTQQIQGLERHLGVRLFSRNKRVVRLTPAGELYRTEAERIVEDIARVEERVRRAEHGLVGSLTIGTSSANAVGAFPSIVRSFRSSHPEVYLQIKMVPAREGFDALDGGRVKILVGRVPARPNIVLEPLWDAPFRVVLPADHRQARRARVRLDELSGETLITIARPFSHPEDELLRLCRHVAFLPGAIEEVAGVEDILALVACGYGIAILAQPWEAFTLPGIVFRPIAGDGGQRAVTAACWREDEESPTIHHFVAIAKRHAGR